MGIIQRQGIKYSILSYVGILIGTISTLFIYPLNLEAYGLAQFLISSAALLSPFVVLGTNVLPIKFMPYFEELSSGHRGFFSLLLLLGLLLSILFALFFILGQDYIIQYLVTLNPANGKQLAKFVRYLLPYSILIGWNTILLNYIISFQRIVIPNLLNNVMLKIALPVFILMTVYAGWNHVQFIYALIVIQILLLLGQFLYIKHLGQLYFKPIQWSYFGKRFREMSNFAMFGMAGGIGGILAYRIDSIMIPALVGLSSNGAYSLAVFMANAIAVPTDSISRISSPILSKALKENNLSTIKQIYRDASLSLFWIGVLMYTLLMANIKDLVSILPTERDLSVLIPVAGILGVAKLMDMITSVNSEIISYSKFYRFNLFFIILLGIFSILLNYYFIQTLHLGILGASYATALSLLTFNISKVAFIWLRFGIHPFQRSLGTILITGIVLYLLNNYLDLQNPWINILLHSTLIVAPYLYIMYRLGTSPQWNDIIDQLLQKIGIKV